MVGDNRLVETGLIWETWKVGCTRRDGGSRRRTARVDYPLDLEGPDETGGEFGGGPLQGKILCPEPNPLSGSVSVLRGRQAMFIRLYLRAGGCVDQRRTCVGPNGQAPAQMGLDGRNRYFLLQFWEQGWLIP